MLEIKFNNEETKIQITNLKRISDNIIAITGVDQNDSGFITYIDGKQVGDFSNYNTIYRVIDNEIYFSNDGSVYKNPTVTIKVNFDNEIEAPKSVNIVLNTKEEITITSPWTKEIEYSEDNPIYDIESADDIANYEKVINGLEVDYFYITAEERNKREIEKLKMELSSTDYQIIKCAEYQLQGLEMPYNTTALHATRQALRDRINELEDKI